MSQKVFCVISHTHWDREWYMPFEVFRLKLVDLIDHLFAIIDRYPEYVFHLDAQTVVLEDYLAIRPKSREKLKKYIQSGNIIIGPWYLQNDFYLTSGEATVRNLLEGRRLAAEYGKCSGVGYAPDQFGNISQLPQILQNFGLDNFVFGRGYSTYSRDEEGGVSRNSAPLEFIWEGPNGSQVLAIHMRCWYNNAQRIPKKLETMKLLTDIIQRDFNGMMSTELFLLMNGVDHLEPQDDLIPLMEEYNKAFGEEGVMKQYTLDRYVSEVKNSISKNNIALTTHRGELRCGNWGDILSGTLSSRHYLKVENIRLQNELEHVLEPLYSMLALSGCKNVYPSDHMRYAWKKLMQNHPHDSICGCSRDEVHDHMEDNFRRLWEFSYEMERRGAEELYYHCRRVKEAKETKYHVLFANTTAKEKREVITIEADFLAEDGMGEFELLDGDGNRIPYLLLHKERAERDVFSPLNLPGRVWVDRCLLRLQTPTVAPFGTCLLSVKPGRNGAAEVTEKERFVLENEALRVEISELGKIDVTSKTTGQSRKDILYLEDVADRGDAYNYYPAGDTPITTENMIPSLRVLENDQLLQSVELTWKMQLPLSYDFERLERSRETAETVVSLQLSLSAADDALQISYRIDNASKDHRIRLLFRSGMETPRFFADIPFDVVEREDTPFDWDLNTHTFPNTSFASAETEGKGMALLTEGAQETEIVDKNKLALTLLRSTGIITRQPDLLPGGGRQWMVPSNQCLRTVSGRVAVLLYAGEAAELVSKAVSFRTKLLALCLPTDRKAFAGGRTAVQDTKLAEFFYLPDLYPEGIVQENKSLVTVAGKNIAVSALKQAEEKNGFILRYVNMGTQEQKVIVTADREIYHSDMAETEGKKLGEGTATLTAGAKEIVTLLLK